MTRYSVARYDDVYETGVNGVAAGAISARGVEAAEMRSSGRKQLDALIKEEELAYSRAIICRAILPIVVLVIIIGLVVMLFIINSTPTQHGSSAPASTIDYVCSEQCRASLVETVPSYLSLGAAPGNQATLTAWTKLIGSATASVDIMTRWMSLLSVGNSSSSGAEGKAVFDALAAAAKRGVALTILQDDSASPPVGDADNLKRAGGSVTVKNMNFSGILGVELDATFIVVDGKHFYLGSADLSQSSLTQRKELGVVVYNCSCLTTELGKLSKGYWQLDGGGSNASMPWPANLAAHFNVTMPLNVTLTADGSSGGSNVGAYVTASVASPYHVQWLSQDSDAILAALAGATSTIDIAVAGYAPVTDDGNTFWPVIDSAIRSAAVQQQARVRLLVSAVESTDGRAASLQQYLASLVSFNSRIQARLYTVSNATSVSSGLDAGVVINNNNYLVTDSVAFVGTSAWTATNFVTAFRMGLVANETSVGPSSAGLRAELQATFERDWRSPYARNLTGCPAVM